MSVRLEPYASITGRLVDANNVPLVAARVLFAVLPVEDFSPYLEQTTTDADGKFRQTAVLPGASYMVLVEGNNIGISEIAEKIAVEPGETVDLGTIDITAEERPEPVRTKAVAAAG